MLDLESHRAACREYHAANKDKIAKRKAEYYLRNKARILNQSNTYYEKNKAKIAQNYQANKEEIAARNRENKDIRVAQSRAYYAANKRSIAERNWANRKQIAKRSAARYAADPIHRLKVILRSRSRLAIKAQRAKKSFQSHVKILGCTVAEARQHIEAQFESWMTWENHGLHGWHIDHIKPLAAFDLSDPAQVAEAFHYTNLRPLHWRANMQKGARLIKN